MAQQDSQGNIIPSPGQTFGDPIPRATLKWGEHSSRGTAPRGLKFAIEWIALNDEPGEYDIDTLAGFISVQLVADIFRRDPIDIAERVVLLKERKGW